MAFSDAPSPHQPMEVNGQPPSSRDGRRLRKREPSVASTSSSSSPANTLADLTSCVRRTSGQTPPGLVGFSSTVIGDKLYLFGGRLVHVRRMVNDLWALDLRTLVWEKLWPPERAAVDHVGDNPPQNSANGHVSSEPRGPQPRYFHSADAWGTKLLIFGGMGQSLDAEGRPGQDTSQADNGADPNLSVLADLLIYDTVSGQWSFPHTTVREGVQAPHPRYAHLSAISNGCLAIVGGQDILNRYIEQLCYLELETMTYVQNTEWSGHVGTYRSVAVSRAVSVEMGGFSNRVSTSSRDRGYSIGTLTSNGDSNSNHMLDESLQLPYTTPASEDEPVYTFTNYNFAEVRRALDMLSAPCAPDWTSDIISLSDLMTGSPSLPPGLRFPTASMVGPHLVLTGTLITQQVSSFAIWTLNLTKMMASNQVNGRLKLTWQKIDAGHALKSGSWNRSVAWKNSVVILGDRDRDIAVDYNRRQNNFSHVVFVDLETFGIYQPPPRVFPIATQELGLNILNQPLLADFELVCTDGVRLPCSRQVLEDRWPWFKAKLLEHSNNINKALVSLNFEKPEEARSSGPAVSSHRLLFNENSSIGLAVLQYFYTLNLITPLQHSIPILVSLLLFGKDYDLTHLRALVVHALHVKLTNGTVSPAIVYEAATLGGAIAIQTRALKMMMNANARSRTRPATQESSKLREEQSRIPLAT